MATCIKIPANVKVTKHPRLGVYKFKIPHLASWNIFHAIHKNNESSEPNYEKFLFDKQFKIYEKYVTVPLTECIAAV